MYGVCERPSLKLCYLISMFAALVYSIKSLQLSIVGVKLLQYFLEEDIIESIKIKKNVHKYV